MDFPERLTDIMEVRKITAYRIAKDLGVAESLVGYWKRGIKQPTLENVIRLAKYFNVSIDYLVGCTDIPDCLVGRSDDPTMK